MCSIGCTDPTAAAGLTADLRVYQKAGVAGMSVVAGVTAQNQVKVIDVVAIAPATIRRQLECVWNQATPAAVRIGLLPNAAAARTVAAFLAGLARSPAVVLDPVLASTSGYRFVDERTLQALRRLIPFATILTPNIAEAAELAGQAIETVADAERVARMLARRGCAVLVKGGHLPGRQSIDVLASGDVIERFASARIDTRLRGKGCMLAAAIAAGLARGDGLRSAVISGRRFVQTELRQARV
ncbi:MAG: bifunctional hydroxymethylpyrimidine kinase/phosphomethylpyrimidine kinase [Candidatus Eremiobacteraeota bacterium]|nr:bifunctional hydroxymethylpyrimidine kinase/phosphomethylpyrimidine kinase [Candidatus Eremiobacteraeota bacterium]